MEREMDTQEVLENWSDIESDEIDESDVSSEESDGSEESDEESEDSSAGNDAADDDTSDTWREVPGLYNLVKKFYMKQ